MKRKLSLEKVLPLFIILFFSLFLIIPLIYIVKEAIFINESVTFSQIGEIFQSNKWLNAFFNSIKFSLVSALISILLSGLLSYGINFTNIPNFIKTVTKQILIFPMLLPTITYGFVLIYSFGKQGLWSRLLGSEIFSIYGSNGIILGLVLYSFPVAFILIDDAMKYIDKRFIVISRLMGDGLVKRTYITIVHPLIKVLAIAFVQSFFMSFTDFGIPVAVGGKENFITTLLYEHFMGSTPNFSKGSVIALSMLIPSIISVILLGFLQKKNVTFEDKTQMPLSKNKFRDTMFTILLFIASSLIIMIFLVMFIIPFASSWPYDLSFSLFHIKRFFEESSLLLSLKNGIITAILTATIGTVIVYFTAVFIGRENRKGKIFKFIDNFSNIINSIPGMVLGISYLLVYSGTTIHNTISILVIVNIIHYFATPYQMFKTAFQKMNQNWEKVAKIMGDRWINTIFRVIIPNSKITIIEVFSYYFTNAMVTISAVVFLTSAKTMVLTTKIKELQHFGRFTEIFILSILILVINLMMRTISQIIVRRIKRNEETYENTRENSSINTGDDVVTNIL